MISIFFLLIASALAVLIIPAFAFLIPIVLFVAGVFLTIAIILLVVSAFVFLVPIAVYVMAAILIIAIARKISRRYNPN